MQLQRPDLTLTLNEDHSSFEENKMMVQTDQLLPIKHVTLAKIYPGAVTEAVPCMFLLAV